MPLEFNPLPDKNWLLRVSVGSLLFVLGFLCLSVAGIYRFTMGLGMIEPLPGAYLVFWPFAVVNFVFFAVGMSLWTLNEPHHGRGPIGDTAKPMLYIVSILSLILFTVVALAGRTIYDATDTMTLVFYFIFAIPLVASGFIAWPLLLSHGIHMVCDALSALSFGTLIDWGMRLCVGLSFMALFSLVVGAGGMLYFLIALFVAQILLVMIGGLFISGRTMYLWSTYDAKAAEWEMRHISRAEMAKAAREAVAPRTVAQEVLEQIPLPQEGHFHNSEGMIAGGIAAGAIFLAGKSQAAQAAKAEQESPIEIHEDLYVEESELPVIEAEKPLPIAPTGDEAAGLSYEQVALYDEDAYQPAEEAQMDVYDDGPIQLDDDLTGQDNPVHDDEVIDGADLEELN